MLNSAANGMYYFNLVVFLDLGCGILGPGNDLLVQGHGEIRRLNIQLPSQILKVLAFQDFPVFAINSQFQEKLSKKGARFGPQWPLKQSGKTKIVDRIQTGFQDRQA